MAGQQAGERGLVDEQRHADDLLAAYLLGSVTSSERALVEAHLATCATCQSRAVELREAVARLPLLAGDVAPSPALKARLMAVVRADAAANGAGVPLLPVVPSARDRRPQPAERRPWVWLASADRRAWWRPRLGSPALAMAALLTLLVVSVTLWRLSGEGQPRPTVTYAMAGTPTQPSITGSLAYYGAEARLQLDLRGLRPLPGSQVYELWLIRGHYRVVKAVGAFRVGSDGAGHLSVLSDTTSHYTMACLTVEAAPGPARPTLPLVAIAALTH